MKGFGKVILFIGVCWAVFALNMDVSVATGAGGRVNNLGLMADRQIHTILGGIIALAGLLMILLSGKPATTSLVVESDSRPCPMCAETIKNAAIKCKHCGADVPPFRTGQAPLTHGWTVRIECEPWAYSETTNSVKRLGLPTTKGNNPKLVVAGPFKSETEASRALENLRTLCDLQGELHLVEPSS
ncbi:hypothetical protein ACQKP6_09005 [Pseudomonas fluorescens]|uniref:hypothetical protein n=1 Tax=Pseudomonas fluorescens TaxID=294 RepID=UPI003D02F308